MHTVTRTLTLIAALMLLVPAAGLAQAEAGQAAPEAFAYASSVGSPVQEIRIEIKECPWCRDDVKQLARDLIMLQEGAAFTEELYRQSLDALELSKRFEEIVPSIERTDGGIVVAFSLKPNWEIEDIRIRGEYPLFKSDVLKAMSVYPGDTLLPDALGGQEKLIADLYKKEGYINPVVTVTAEKNPLNGTAIIDVLINGGPYFALDSLKLKGNDSILDTEIKSRMIIWRSSFFLGRSGRFREADLQQDIKDLTALYWQRGYPECEIRYTLSKDESTGKVKATLTFSEGPFCELSITGNHAFFAYTLKKDVVIFREGNRRDRGLTKSIKNMEQRYRVNGYLFTDIAVVEEKITIKEKKIRRIELAISEGPRTLVGTVRFAGNTAFDEERLMKAMQTGKSSLTGKKVFVPEVLDEDLAAISALYLKNGYNGVVVSQDIAWSTDKTRADITVTIVEGVRTMVSSVRIDGLTIMSEEKASRVLLLKEGKPFGEGLVKAGEEALSDLISEKGHPYVTVKGETTLSTDRTRADVIFRLVEGPHVTMGNIYYRGNLRTKTRVLDRELGIKPGEDFSLKTMLNGQKNIRDMEIFDSVQFKTLGVKEKRDRITLLIDMEEVKSYYLQAGAGYANDLGVYGKARAGDRNLFGLNKDAWLGGLVSQTGYNGQLSVTSRRIFGTPISSTYGLSYERKEEFNQTFGTSVWTSSLRFLREFKPQHLTSSLEFRYERRDEFLIDASNPSNVDTYDPRSILVTTPFISYDTRDSFVRPREGTYSSLSMDVSKGLLNSFDNFIKYYLNLRYYLSPTRRITFAWLARFGYIDPYGTVSNIPDDQLLYLGGTLSVRGYDENMLRYDANRDPVGGRIAMVGSMEARLEVKKDWEITLFYDTGAVREALVDAGSDSFRSSVGIGMRYLTPIGPIGLLYGQKLSPRDGESSGKYHFSMGYTF